MDNRERLWLNTDDYNLHVLKIPPTSRDIKDLEIRRITYMKNEEDTPVRVLVTKLFQDKTGAFWMFSPAGLYRFWEEPDGESFSISKKFPEATDPAWKKSLEELDETPGHFSRIGPGRDGGIWVGCADKVGYWNAGSSTWQQYPLSSSITKNEPNFWNEAFELWEDSRGEVWITFIQGC
ncbi:MAG: hypothetical protein IPJ40_03070 [Saprospirales bacterium]|nr:hypothetical protein [Saprospirales bacterium]